MRKILVIFLISFILVISVLFIYLRNPISGNIGSDQLKSVALCNGCNVIFIVLDPLRADHLSSYGYSRSTTPAIDSLANRGYLFQKAISASSWTLPADMSLLTGVYPSTHKVLNKFTVTAPGKQKTTNLKDLSPDISTAAEIYKKNGYQTAGFTGSAAVNRQYGYNTGFDSYTDNREFAGFDYVLPMALDWLKTHEKDKFFLFLQGYDTHGEYVGNNGYDYRYLDFKYNGKLNGSKDQEVELREQGLAEGKLFLTPDDARFLNDIYDEKLNRADKRISDFITAIKKMGLLENTVIVFTSGHGEELYDHGNIDHGHSLYNELIHVPLIISLPRSTGGVKIKNQVRSIDILPTLLSLTSIQVDSHLQQQFQGVSLVPLMAGKDIKLDAFSETDYRYATFKRAVIIAGGLKLITDLETKVNELYNINNDPKEKNNLAQKDSRNVERLKSLIVSISGSLRR